MAYKGTRSNPRRPFTKADRDRSSITHKKHKGNLIIVNVRGCGELLAAEQHGCASLTFLSICSPREFWYAVGVGLKLSYPFCIAGKREPFILKNGVPIEDLFDSLAVAGQEVVLERILGMCLRTTVSDERRDSLMLRVREAKASPTLAPAPKVDVKLDAPAPKPEINTHYPPQTADNSGINGTRRLRDYADGTGKPQVDDDSRPVRDDTYITPPTRPSGFEPASPNRWCNKKVIGFSVAVVLVLFLVAKIYPVLERITQ